MKLSNSQITSVKKIFTGLEIGEVISINPVYSSQNIVYKVNTKDNKYILKEYTKDAIRNEYDLSKRKRQISVSEKLNQNGVNTILPIKFHGRNFIKHKDRYYLLYDFFEYNSLTKEEVDTKRIKKLATTLARIHKINIKADLPCQYKQIKIDLNKYLKKYKKLDSTLYKVLYDNYFVLENLISTCNNSIKYVKNTLCVSHNDYKLGNILWNKDEMYLIDFDACAMINPATSLAECSFSLSRHNNAIDLHLYKEFLKAYLKEYGDLKTSYKDALAVAMNGKLQWLEYLMSNCSKRKPQRIKDTICMIKELSLYSTRIDNFNEIYLSLIKK